VSPLFGGSRREPDGPRSAAQREAARQERERRRAEREGRPLPPAAEPAPAESVHVEPPPAPGYDELPTPMGSDPISGGHADFLPHDDHGGLTPYDEPAEIYAPEPVTVPAEPEAPVPLRRVGAPSVRDLPQVAGPRPVAAAPPRGRIAGRGRRVAARLLVLVVLLVIVAAGYFAFRLFQPFAGDGDASHPVAITVPRGATASEVGDLLERRGVIDSSFFFRLRARLSGKRDALKAGRFTLRRDMSYAAALDALTATPKPPPVIHVTVPEGRSIAEEAPLIHGAGLKGSYLKAAGRNPRTIAALRRYSVPKGTRTLEGFLFPATYELKRSATARDLVDEQIAAFRRTFDGLDFRAAERRNLTPYDVLIIASMIEREAQVPKDRRLISAVIYNRLHQHMPLGIDATLRYRLNNWSRPLRQSELQTDSAFNTRTRQGLPPTPIGSPGLASIQAALNPAKAPYLFYVVKPCGNGAHAFSSTDAQFQRDVAAYNRKRNQLGGKDPSHC
jgi:UPF0755 protein